MPIPPSQPPQPEDNLSRVRHLASASQWLLGGFCTATIAAIILAVQLETGLFWGAVSFLGWGVIVSLIHFLYFRFELVELRDMGASQTPVKNLWSEVSRDQKPTDATDEGPRIERQSLFHWFQRRGEIICLVVGVLLVIGPIQAALLMRTLLSVDSASLLRTACGNPGRAAPKPYEGSGSGHREFAWRTVRHRVRRRRLR